MLHAANDSYAAQAFQFESTVRSAARAVRRLRTLLVRHAASDVQ